jgi:hypothetical protein
VVRPLAERPAGSRRVEALVPAAGDAVVDELVERLALAARGYARRSRERGTAAAAGAGADS